MNHVFGRSNRHAPPIAVAGEGCFLIDEDGKRYLDGSGGAAISCLGHSDAKVKAAVRAQLDALPFAHTRFFSSRPAEALADRLVEAASGALSRVYFVSGGSEGIETAIKLARQHALEIGQPERVRLIARRQSYHGNTLGALALGGNPKRREPFAPLLASSRHIDPCHAYRHRREDESEEAYAERAAQALEDEILALGPETVLAFAAETVVGSTLGAAPASPGYFRRIREICDRHGVLLILDEVMCGVGRTGSFFAFEQEGIVPDIAVLAKGLGAGYMPIGAVLCASPIYDAITHGSGAFKHGHSFIAHPTAAAAGVAVMQRLFDDGVLADVAPKGAALRARLDAAFGHHPHIGDIRGRGLFFGIELVADRASKAPFPRDRGVAARLKDAAFEEGLICYPDAGGANGEDGDHVLLAPPFVIGEKEMDMLVERLARAVRRVVGG